jgi:hypothetical protein
LTKKVFYYLLDFFLKFLINYNTRFSILHIILGIRSTIFENDIAFEVKRVLSRRLAEHNNSFTYKYSVDFVGYLDSDEVLSIHLNLEDKENFNQLNPKDPSEDQRYSKNSYVPCQFVAGCKDVIELNHLKEFIIN